MGITETTSRLVKMIHLILIRNPKRFRAGPGFPDAGCLAFALLDMVQLSGNSSLSDDRIKHISKVCS